MAMLRHYLVWTWRTLAADPLTTLLNLLALSLGLVSFALAAATVLFLRSNDIDLPNADRIYTITEEITGPEGNIVEPRTPYASALAAKFMEADYPEIGAITLLRADGPRQVVADGKSHRLVPRFFGESFTRVVKLPLRHGSPEQAFASPRSAVLTAETSEKLFGDADPVGRALRISGVDVTITGVIAPMAAPSLFRSSFTNDIDLLASSDVLEQVAPLSLDPDDWDDADGAVLVLLPRGQSPEGLRAKLADFGPRHVQHLQRRYHYDLVPLVDTQKIMAEGLLRTDKTGLSVSVLLIALGWLVLFVASLNYANLAGAKAMGRLPESGMRKVLGASRFHLLAQYLTESLVLACAGLVMVLVVLAFVAGPFAQATGADLYRLLFHRPAFWLLLVAGIVTATVLGGLYPALLLSGQKAIAATLGGKSRPARSRLASFLIGLQFLAASFLLIMVGIMALQNRALRQEVQSLGGGLLAIDTPLDGAGITGQDVITALREIPGVEAQAGINMRPWALGSAQHRYFKDASVKGPPVVENDYEVTEDYFSVLGSHLLAGRLFSADRGGDLRPEEEVPTASFNIIVDRGFAEAFGWTPEQAIGQNVWHYTLNGSSAPVQIIGVIENQPQTVLAFGASGSVFNLAPKHAQIFLVRLARGAGAETLTAIDKALIRLAPQLEWHRHFVDELFKQSAAILTAVIAALTGLALFAVAIALLGLIGMVIHTTNSRTEEIGIRKILGADDFSILRLLAWDLTKPVLIASLAAWPLAYIAGHIYLALFTSHIALGPWPFLISLAATIAVAWLAVGWRIAMASVKSPAKVLRYE